MTIIEEKSLIEKCISGDKKSWDDFIEKYSKLVYNTIYRTLEITGYKLESDLIEDLYQDFFLSILKDDFHKLKKFTWKNRCSIATWLSIISRNIVHDFMRKNIKYRETHKSIDGKTVVKEREVALENVLKHTGKSAHEMLIDVEEVEILKKAIKNLSNEDRILLEMLYYQEQPVEDIAKILNKSADALYMQKKRLIEKLRENIEKIC